MASSYRTFFYLEIFHSENNQKYFCGLQLFAKMMAIAVDFHQIRNFWKLVKIWVLLDCVACYTSLRDTLSF